MALLNGTNQIGQNLSNAINGGSQLTQQVNSQSYTPQQVDPTGYVVPASPAADGTGLPSRKIPSQQLAVAKRYVMSWFVPEVGIINMYVNPQSISYEMKKLITQQRTKGGYSINYWGEQLTTLRIEGHTGSSGIEGLNVLEEIYRSEQLLFDPIALTMASDSSISGLNNLIDNTLGNLGSFGQTISTATQGLFGINPLSQTILPSNIPSLASMAFGIEMYWMGAVYRGYFESFSYSESVEKLGLFTYNINFVVTQKRGYRTNTFPWQHSATQGPSNWGPGGPALSFSTLG